MDQFNRSLESEIVVEGILKDVLSRIYSNEDEKIEKEKAEEDKKRLELEIEEEKKLKEREERLKQREEENSDDSGKNGYL